MIKVKRIYETVENDDGYRILVDRLWPRGIKKDDASLYKWMKDIAPSDELRKFFSHDTDKYEEFKKRYFKELDNKKDIIKQIYDLSLDSDVTLLYAAKDIKHNNAKALKEYIKKNFFDDGLDSDKNIIEKISLFGKALSDPKRIEMLLMFAENKRCFAKLDGTKVESKEETPDGICVCHFVNKFDMGQSKVSYHIKILKEAGLIKETVAGKWTYYDIDNENFNNMINVLKNSILN